MKIRPGDKVMHKRCAPHASPRKVVDAMMVRDPFTGLMAQWVRVECGVYDDRGEYMGMSSTFYPASDLFVTGRALADRHDNR